MALQSVCSHSLLNFWNASVIFPSVGSNFSPLPADSPCSAAVSGWADRTRVDGGVYLSCCVCVPSSLTWRCGGESSCLFSVSLGPLPKTMQRRGDSWYQSAPAWSEACPSSLYVASFSLPWNRTGSSFLSPFYRWVNWGSDQLHSLLKVRTWDTCFCDSKPLSFPLSHTDKTPVMWTATSPCWLTPPSSHLQKGYQLPLLHPHAGQFGETWGADMS